MKDLAADLDRRRAEHLYRHRRVLDGAQGPVLAYCRSGTRSTNLWALARARAGDDPAALCASAAAAGYDLSGIRATLDMLAADAR